MTPLWGRLKDLAGSGFAEVMGPGEFVQAHPLLAITPDSLAVHRQGRPAY